MLIGYVVGPIFCLLFTGVDRRKIDGLHAKIEDILCHVSLTALQLSSCSHYNAVTGGEVA